MIGILAAIEAELRLVRDAIEDRVDENVLGTTIHRGQIDGVNVLVAKSGVGKVNAALATAALAQSGATSVLFNGVAGGTGVGIHVGDIVVATDLVQHDVDVTPLGRALGELLGEPLAWAADEKLRERARVAAHAVVGEGSVHVGRIASGDQFVASEKHGRWLRATFNAVCAEMEGAAMAQACTRLGLPFAVVRSISDEADARADVDFPAFLEMASVRGVALVRAYLKLSREM